MKMWDDKLYLSSFKTKRGTVIATMYSKEEVRKILIDRKEGEIFQTIEKRGTNKILKIHCTLDFLIDRFKRTDQRKKAIGHNTFKFTDFGLGFIYGVYFKTLGVARKSLSEEEDSEEENQRRIYYQVFQKEITDKSLRNEFENALEAWKNGFGS